MRAGAQAIRTADRRRGASPELACVHDLVSTEVLGRAELRAARLGTGTDRALIASGALDEETYVQALAAELGGAFATLDDLPRAACPLGDARLIEAAAAGIAVLTVAGSTVWLLAPQHLGARGLIDLIVTRNAPPGDFRLTTTARLDRFVLRAAGATLAEQAANGLFRARPQFSAARRSSRTWPTLALVLALAALAFALVPLLVEAALALFFIAWLA